MAGHRAGHLSPQVLTEMAGQDGKAVLRFNDFAPESAPLSQMTKRPITPALLTAQRPF